MIPVPEKAFLLAAGMGSRLRPYTNTMPKPMVPVAGRPLLDYALDELVAAGVKEVMINLHYLPNVIKAHLLSRNDINIHFSEEETLLNTGGGLKKCADFFKNEPFFMINGDSLWENGQKNTLLSMCETYDLDKSDILLLLQSLDTMSLTEASGDYDIRGDQAYRNNSKQGRYAFTGLRLVNSHIFEYKHFLPAYFSFLDIMDEAEKQGRLGYHIHQGHWHHISKPADLVAVDDAYRGSSRG